MNSNIRKLRNEKNISQTTLANILGKTQQTISHMERDRDRIPIESLITLADYFGVSTDYILGVEPKVRFNPKDMPQAGPEPSEPEKLHIRAGLFNNIQGEKKEIIYQLILSLLLYSLEDDAEAIPAAR